MRIQHNIPAMNAYRNYNNNTSALSKNLEKLSSGYAINRAGDDAAGLAISEKMRAQITGLDTAQKNAKDGISLVQTAEGALTEVHDMLNRMYELANQSANGTYDDAVDRENLQKEITALNDEIDRISQATNFNGINLLDGTQATVVTEGTLVQTATSGQIGQTEATDMAGVISGNTLLGETATEATKTSFSVDLGDLTVTATDADQLFAITVGGTASVLSTEAGDIANGATVNADTLASLLAEEGTVDIGGVVYEVSVDATNKSQLNFVMQDNPLSTATAANLNGNFDIAFAATSTVTENSTIADSTQNIVEGTAPNSGLGNATFAMTAGDIVDGATVKIGEETYMFKVGANSEIEAPKGTILVDLSDIETVDAANLDIALDRLTVAAAGNKDFTVGQGAAAGSINIQQKAGSTLDTTSVAEFQKHVEVRGAATIVDDSLTLQIGDTSAAFNQISVSISDMGSESLGIADIDISTQEGAAAATDLIKAAINSVSSTRGDLGAVQNRLEHTINNLSVTEENITDAESSIRDTDVAEEMMAYTKNNILVQSAQAMLAQANQLPQGVLQLLG